MIRPWSAFQMQCPGHRSRCSARLSRKLSKQPNRKAITAPEPAVDPATFSAVVQGANVHQILVAVGLESAPKQPASGKYIRQATDPAFGRLRRSRTATCEKVASGRLTKKQHRQYFPHIRHLPEGESGLHYRRQGFGRLAQRSCANPTRHRRFYPEYHTKIASPFAASKCPISFLCRHQGKCAATWQKTPRNRT